MAQSYLNLGKFGTTSTGTGAITLTKLAGFPAPALTTGDTYDYTIQDVNGDTLEVGTAPASGAAVLNRAAGTVVQSSNANNLVNFAAGSKTVVLSVLASRVATAMAHPSTATAAHAATAIAFAPTGTIAATTVQAAIAEAASEANAAAASASAAASTAQAAADAAQADVDQALSDAAAAQSTANSAASDASSALSTANTASSNATSALNAANTAQTDATAALSGLSGKSDNGHTHAFSDIPNLQTTLDGKAASSHTHPAAEISDSTSAGRDLLTAANVGAQQTILGVVAPPFAISDVTGLQTALDSAAPLTSSAVQTAHATGSAGVRTLFDLSTATEDLNYTFDATMAAGDRFAICVVEPHASLTWCLLLNDNGQTVHGSGTAAAQYVLCGRGDYLEFVVVDLGGGTLTCIRVAEYLTPPPPVLLYKDDQDGSPGFTNHVSLTTFSSGAARAGGCRFSNASGKLATYTFSGLRPATYKLHASWIGDANRSTSTRYVLKGTGSSDVTVSGISQVSTPADLTESGVGYKLLTSTFSLDAAGSIDVEVWNDHTGFVILDAIKLERVD